MKQPYPFQLEGSARARAGNLLIGDSPGLGKTLQAIEAIKGLIGPKLVVCPKVVKEQWRKEIIEQTDGIARMEILGTSGRIPNDSPFEWGLIHPSNECYNIWIITHYETLLKIGSILVQIPWVGIVLDESHRIKNRKAKQSLWMKMIRGAANGEACRRIALSATPMERRPSELWAQLSWLNPDAFTSYWAFREVYDEEEYPYPGAEYKAYLGPKNLDQLAERVSPYVIIRKKEDVLPDLPPKIIHEIPLQMENKQKKLYDQLSVSKDIEVELALEEDRRIVVISNTLSLIMKLQQISSDPRLLQYDIPSSKIEWVLDYLDDNPHGSKVIFTRFRNTAIRLVGLLGEQNTDLIVGGMSDPITRVSHFLTGKKKYLVGTIDAMKEGLNLQVADTAIFIDQHWSSIKMTQAEDRIHRMDIKDPKNIIYLYNEGTVDEMVKDAFLSKWSHIQLVERFLRKGDYI